VVNSWRMVEVLLVNNTSRALAKQRAGDACAANQVNCMAAPLV